MKLILLLFAVLAAKAQTTAIRDDQALFNNSWNFRYSVDSVNGSDSNDGNSRWRPFQTLTKVKTRSISDNYSIGFARGSYWRSGLNLSADYLGSYAYGSGARPIIDGAEPCTSWTLASGMTSTYQCPVTFETTWGADQINAWENGVFLTKQTSIANVEASAGSYFVSSITVSPAILYVHPTAGGNPSTNGIAYEYASHGEQLSGAAIHGSLRGQGWTIRGIHATRNLGPSGSLACGRLCSIIDSVADYGSRHNILCSDGCLVRDSTIADAYDVPQTPSLIVGNETTPIGLGMTLRRVTVQASNSPQQQSTITGISTHSGGSGTFGAMLLDTTTVNLSGQNVATGNVQSATVTGGNYAGEFLLAQPTAISNMTFSGTPGTAGAFNIQSAGTAITVRNSAITVGGVLINFSFAGSFDIQNSTVTEATNFASLFYGPSTSGVSVTRLNNTFGPASGITYGIDNLKTDAAMVSDYNTWNGYNTSTLYDYQYATGLDLNSTPNLTAVPVARWNLGASHVVGSTIPDIDGLGLNLAFPGGAANPTSQTAGVSFGANTYLSTSTPPNLGGKSPGITATVVVKWTGTAGGMTTDAYPVRLDHGVTIHGGLTASKVRAEIGAFSSTTPTSTTSIDDGGWHAITAVANQDNTYLFVDGVVQGTSGSDFNSGITANTTLFVGSYTDHTKNWQGLIAYVEYDKGQMAPSQITAFYASLKSSLAAQGVTLP